MLKLGLKEILIIVVILILIVILIAFVIFKISRIRLSSQMSNNTERVQKRKKELIEDLNNKIDRFFVISKNNETYKDQYENLQLEKEELIAKYDSKIQKDFFDAENEYKSRHFKNAKNALEKLEKDFDSFELEVQVLKDKMDDVLSREDSCNNDALVYKQKYNEIKEIYEKEKDVLELLGDCFPKLFKKIDKIFDEYEELISYAYYDDALKKISSLEEAFEYTFNCLKIMPELVVRTKQIIPNKIAELKSTFEKLTSQNYPLEHINFDSNIKNAEAKLLIINDNLEHFKYHGIKEQLDSIELILENISKKFWKEEKSKDNYDGKYLQERNRFTQDVLFKFGKVYQKLPGYRKIYLIDEKCLQKVKEVKSNISQLTTILKDIENCTHGSFEQPFSTVEKKISDLESLNSKVIKDIDCITKYLNSLKNDCQKAYSLLEEKYLEFKELEYKLNQIRIESVYDSLIGDLIDGYNALNQIGISIEEKPINVNIINENVNIVNEKYEVLYDNIHRIIDNIKKSEASIVHANRYKIDFVQERENIDNAEKYFFEGDFVKVINESGNIIKRITKSE